VASRDSNLVDVLDNGGAHIHGAVKDHVDDDGRSDY